MAVCFVDNEMKQPNIQNVRQKRAGIQQGIISLLSIVCLLFSCVWGVHAAKSKTQFFAPSNDDSSSVASADAKKKNVKKKDSSSASDKNSSKADDSSKEAHDEADDLSDAVFIGDSRTVALENACPYPKATFLCFIGMHVDNALTEYEFTLSNGNTGTLIDALSEAKYNRVFINLGTNELGWPYIENWIEYYKELVDAIKEVQPDATIYAESILPVAASREYEDDGINNTNVTRFNEAIQEICEEKGIEYLNCFEAVADEFGNLPEEASTDGIHLLGDYCDKWLQYIIDNT